MKGDGKNYSHVLFQPFYGRVEYLTFYLLRNSRQFLNPLTNRLAGRILNAPTLC